MHEDRPLLRKVDCIRIPVPDLGMGLAFYRDQLGHRLNWRDETSVGLSLPEADTEIVLFTDPESMEVDFLVDSATDAAGAIERAGGRVVTPPFDIRIGKCAVVEDPFGNCFIVLDLSKGLLVTDEAGNVIGTAQRDPPEDGEPRSSP